MSEILLAIAPIFLLIILGHLLRRGGIPSIGFWHLNDNLVYWVLFPSLLFYKMATVELSGDLLGDFATVIYLGFGSTVLFALTAGRVLNLGRPVLASVLQGCVRHNTFIALAVAERVFGPEGLALAALITALLIPVTNVSVVTLMVMLLRGPTRGGVIGAIARDLARNPLLIAVTLGIAVNLAEIREIPVVYDMARILGGAALPIVLLCIGANIHVRAMVAAIVPIVVSIAGKMVVFPTVIGLTAFAMNLDTSVVLVAMVFGAVPTAAGAYNLARQMGGDAPAMASIVTVQTAISFITLPLTLLLAERLLTA